MIMSNIKSFEYFVAPAQRENISCEYFDGRNHLEKFCNFAKNMSPITATSKLY